MEDLTFNFSHYECGQVLVDIMFSCIKVQELDITHWTLHEDHKVRLFNLRTIENHQTIKLNVALDELVATNITKHCYRNTRTFSHGLTNLNGIPP